MGCDRYIELLSARLDGELSEGETGELEGHLARCSRCSALADQLASLRTDFFELEELPAPEGFSVGVMERIRAQSGPKVIPLFRRPWLRTAAGLAACAVLCIGLYQSGLFAGEQPFADQTLVNDIAQYAGEDVTEQSKGARGMDAQPPAPAAYGFVETEPDGAALEALTDEADQVLTLDRLPEGALELLAEDTTVGHDAVTGADTYTWLTAETLAAIEKLAFEQGLLPGTSAAAPAGDRCALVVLNK